VTFTVEAGTRAFVDPVLGSPRQVLC